MNGIIAATLVADITIGGDTRKFFAVNNGYGLRFEGGILYISKGRKRKAVPMANVKDIELEDAPEAKK